MPVFSCHMGARYRRHVQGRPALRASGRGGGNVRRGPGGTSTTGRGPQWPPWTQTRGHLGAGRRTAKQGRPCAGGGCATTNSKPQTRGLGGTGPQSITTRGGQAYRRCWPIPGAGRAQGTPGWRGRTTVTVGRGLTAVAGSRGVEGAGPRARALAPGLVLVFPVPLAKKAGGRPQAGKGRTQEAHGSGRRGEKRRWAASCVLGSIPASHRLAGGGPFRLGPQPPSVPAEGGGGVRDAPMAAPSARHSRSAAAAWSHAILPPPHAGVGPLASAGAEPLHRKGHKAITSLRGALLGRGRINTL